MAKDNQQLYHILSALDNYFTDANELGEVIGYGVIDALLRFDTPTGSIEQRKFEEVKAVYATLDEALSSCSSDDSYAVLAGLMGRVDPLLGEIIPLVEQRAPAMVCGKEIDVFTLSRKDNPFLRDLFLVELAQGSRAYADKLSRGGKQVFDHVTRRGAMTGKKNALLADYNVLFSSFGGGSR